MNIFPDDVSRKQIRNPVRCPRAAAIGLAWGLLFVGRGALSAAETDPLVNPAHRIAPAAPGWGDLTGAFARNPDIAADFTERRYFPFKKQPVELKGEVRVSALGSLSLHYTAPEETTVILDTQGTLMRAAAGEKAPPADPHAAVANEALRHIVRFDLAALDKDFELYGARDGTAWTLVLVPRTAGLRDSIGRITVAGEAATIRRIEIRRTATQAIEITIAPPRPPAAFTAEELQRYFRAPETGRLKPISPPGGRPDSN
jgi:hypothetical protein